MSLPGEIQAIAASFSGSLGVCALHLGTGERLEFQADTVFSTASTIKLAVLYEVWRGSLDGRWRLDDCLYLTTANKVEGSGVLQDLTDGLRLSVRDTAVLMTVISDNTATNMLIDLCSMARINQSMAELGLGAIRLNKKIGVRSDLPLGEATPAAMANLMARIGTHSLLTPAACAEMLAILTRQRYKENTSRYIPATDDESGEPAVVIASKSGWVRGVRNDVALVRSPRSTYVLSMFSQDCQDRRYYPDNEGSLALARVSEAVYHAWGAP